MTDVDDDAPGWDAIEAAVHRVVPEQTPLHWGANKPGGVYGLSAYRVDGLWLLVTFGLTELFSKDDEGDPAVSGWGFELTLRVPASGEQPPPWAVNLLDKLGRQVFRAGRPFADGHRLNPGGPLTGEANTRLSAVAFTTDPQLGRIDTPHGTVDFLAVVGVTAEELARMKATSTARVLTELAATSPLLVTDPAR